MISGDKFSGGSLWSRDDDIAFERALAIYTDELENRWEKIAADVPGKTLEQIKEHYEILLHDVTMIESGCVPLPDYVFTEETNDREISIRERGNNSKGAYKQVSDKPKQKRRKGIAWTANEHSLFLLGLDKYGKGDWRSISRNFVVSRTPTQVASHAQKYFARLASKNKNKTRQSIHDVGATTESTNSAATRERPITWQNTQATDDQPNNSQPSLDFPVYNATPTTWNTQGTQATSQPSLDRPVFGNGAPTIWNTQGTHQATSQPSLDLPVFGNGAPTIWNTLATHQATSQPSLDLPVFGNGAPTIWNTLATPQSSLYGMPAIGQSMVGPMVLPFGTDMNSFAPPHMAYGVQHQPVPYFPVPSAPINMGSIPYNMAYTPNLR